MITKGDKHIGRFIYLRCASEFSDAVNDLRQTNNAGYIKFERCTVANAVKGAGTWVESERTIDVATSEFSGTIDEVNDKFTIWDNSLLKWIRFSFASLKTFLKTYFDGIYEPLKGTDDNYVTDAQLIVIGNTSGTNTGDNATNSQYSGLAASKQDTNLKFTDTSAATWSADTTYSGYGYKCELTLTGVTATMIAEVIFAHAEAISGNYSPVSLTGAGTLTIYSKVNTTITIPTILINK